MSFNGPKGAQMMQQHYPEKCIDWAKFSARWTGSFVALLGWMIHPYLSILGLFMVAGGIIKPHHWRCSNCRNPVANKAVRMCPTCRTDFR